MTKSQWLLTAISILVVLLGWYLYQGKGVTQRAGNVGTGTATPLPSVTPVPTPKPSNPLGQVKTNIFNDVKFNPFK